MSRMALFHTDPSTTQVRECVEPDCADEHHSIEVRGADTVETWSCPHHVATVYWSDLTPVTDPGPTCDVAGCAGMTLQG